MISFGAAISACAKAAEWQIALALLNEVSCRMLDRVGEFCEVAGKFRVLGGKWIHPMNILQGV